MGSPDDQADDQLVAFAVAGDADAFDRLVDRYWARAHRFALRMLGDAADAEDAVQEAFLRAYLALGRYESRGRFTGWLFRIVANECRAAGARGSRRRQVEMPDDDAAALVAVETPATDAHDGDIDRALQQLDPLLREAFLLRHVEELDYDQMRTITGAGTSALKMRVKRACDRLRLLLNGVDDA